MATLATTTIVPVILLNSNILANYLGSAIFILGMFGESLNIIVFLSLRTFRQSSCAFYLMLASEIKIIQLLTGLLTRIIASATGVDWTAVSPAYCKIRAYFLEFCPICTLSLLCLAVIDQYFATSTRPNWQQWCHIKTAHRLSAILISICLIIPIPHAIFFDHVVSATTHIGVCIITNNIFQNYNNTFNIPVLYGPLPLLITIIFSILTYRHVKQLAYRTVPLVRRRLDQQLTTMVLTQTIFNLIAIMPSVIMIVTVNFTSIGSLVATNNEAQFVITTIAFVYYFYTGSSFYIYFCTSERFRHQLRYVLFDIHWNRCRNNAVYPADYTNAIAIVRPLATNHSAVTKQPVGDNVHSSFGLIQGEKVLNQWVSEECPSACCGNINHVTLTDQRILLRYEGTVPIPCNFCCDRPYQDRSIFLQQISEMETNSIGLLDRCMAYQACRCPQDRILFHGSFHGSSFFTAYRAAYLNPDDKPAAQQAIGTAIANVTRRH